MVRQAMTFQWQALRSREQACSCPAVIPAQAGIHFRFWQQVKMGSQQQIKMGSRLRGNDGTALLGIDAGVMGSAA